MKPLTLLIFLTMSVVSFASCSKNTATPATENSTKPTDTSINTTSSKMKIKIGNLTFKATLYDNSTATAFKAMLPLTVNMIELNGNEKYINLSRSLPTNVSNPGTIQNGDLMLFGPSTFVLFYKTFSTSYSYTKLGRIDDVTGLVSALGSNNINVSFELELP